MIDKTTHIDANGKILRPNSKIIQIVRANDETIVVLTEAGKMLKLGINTNEWTKIKGKDI